MTDSLGHICWYFTPLVTYIVDTPKAALIAGVGVKTSHLTLASHKSFGDYFRTLTLAQIECLSEDVDPWDLESYAKEAQQCF